MIGNLREFAIARKYSTEWQIIQAFVDIPADTTATITWNPPSGKYFIFQYWISGEMKISEDFSYEVWWDGTRAGDYINQGAMIDVSGSEIPLKMVKHELRTVLKNSTSEVYTFDMMVVGFNIQKNLLDEFIEEITGRKDRRVMEEIRDELKEISRQFRRRPARR